jgi:two-component system, OmpR family, sensor kinase
MTEQVERLTKLATDLLDLSRLDAGRLRIERELVDLADVARTLVAEFQAVAPAGGRPLVAETTESVPALADEQRVQQIGRVLVENALVHTPPGTAVTMRALAADGRATLTVEDNGPGVPAEQAGRLFERFYRLDGSRASGSGLGLAIGRELAQAMNGRIELESRPGWTVFRLSLPLYAESDRPSPAEQPALSA